MKFHPDFETQAWCKTILTSPSISAIEIPTSQPLRTDSSDVSNSMFKQTLYTPSAIRAQVNFHRPTSESDALKPWEYCALLSVGSGLDGKTGRAHGGFNALILDQMTGAVAGMVSGSFAPATATMTVDYKAPIATPGVVLCRSWPVERQGRKTWVKACLEDGNGKVLASGKALFIDPRPAAKI